jgi:hypothetical protein
MQRAVTLALIMIVSALLAACATQPELGSTEAPGFWVGLLHGAIAPFSLIASLFYDVRIYAYPNSGWSYDAGFFLGIAGAAGSGIKYATAPAPPLRARSGQTENRESR